MRRDLQNDLSRELFNIVKETNIPIQRVPQEKLDRLTRKNHQGVIAFISAVTYQNLEDIVPFLYEETLRNHFELPALSDYGTKITFSYGDLAREIAKIHLLLEEQSVCRGDKIALIGKNSAYWGVVLLSAITYGAVIVPILQDFAPLDVHHIVNHSEATILFAADSILKNLDEKEMPALKAVFSIADKSLSNKQEGEALSARLEEKLIAKYPNGFTREDIHYPDSSDDDIVILNYTSGTTGFSKGVLMTKSNLTGNLIFARYEMKLKKGDTLLSLLPLAHAYGCAFEFLYPIMEGCHVTLLGKTPAPKILMKAFSEVKPRLIISVPLILEKIYKNMISPIITKPAIRCALKIPLLNKLIYKLIREKLVTAFGGNFIQVVIGGAPLNKEVEQFLLKIKFPVSVGYGMTECAPLISFSLYSTYIPYSCGKLLPCMEARIDSTDPQKVAGEIQLKGQNVMYGYYKNEEANREVFTDDGWLRTGDLGTLDENKVIFIRGRSKSMLLSASGQNIYPEEIEAKLDNLPYISESLIVTKKGKLVALVYPNYEAVSTAGLSPEDLEKMMIHNKDTINRMLASYEKISEIQLFEEEFEKTPKKSIKRYLYNEKVTC
jgi:long-chain acyl-CoA synthetase